MATDLDAMPDPCSAGAPYFSDQPNEPLAAFLQEFDALATSLEVTDSPMARKFGRFWNTSAHRTRLTNLPHHYRSFVPQRHHTLHNVRPRRLRRYLGIVSREK